MRRKRNILAKSLSEGQFKQQVIAPKKTSKERKYTVQDAYEEIAEDIESRTADLQGPDSKESAQ